MYNMHLESAELLRADINGYYIGDSKWIRNWYG